MKIASVLVALGLAACASAETYYSQSADPWGTCSLSVPGVAGRWNTAADGSGTAAAYPEAGNTYIMRHTLNTPEKAPYTFPGDALVLDDGGNVWVCCSSNNTFTVADLRVPEGAIGSISHAYGCATNTLAGAYSVGAGGRLDIACGGANDGRNFILEAAVTGTGTLQLGNNANNPAFLRVGAAALANFPGGVICRATGPQLRIELEALPPNPDVFDADGFMLSNAVRVVALNGGTLGANRGLCLPEGASATLEIPWGRTVVVESPVCGSGTLVKTGTGKLIFKTASPDFTGTILAKAGYVQTEAAPATIFPNAADVTDVSQQGATVTFDSGCTTRAYATDGLILQYDGLENAGRGVHDPATTKWANLAGAADGTYDVALPNWVEVEDDALLSKVISGLGNDGTAINNSKSAAPTISATALEGITSETPVTTVEVVMEIVTESNGDWFYTDNYNNLQGVFSTPRGGLSYRHLTWNGFCFTYPISSTKTQIHNWRPNAAVTNLHTVAATLGVGANTLWTDGVANTPSPLEREWESNWGTAYKFFANLRANIRVHAIRLYNRPLTATEIRRHSALDRTRFLDAELTAAERNELSFFVPETLPVQDLNGIEDAQPRPEVRNLLTGETLEFGKDYRLSYANNARPGTGRLVVSGLGAYAGLSVTRNFEIRHAFTAEVADNGAGTLTATVRFPSVDFARELYVAHGASDGGETTNGWAAVTCLGTVPANATSATYTLPAAVADSAELRFFLERPVDHRAYVTEGLCALYDGVNNGGTAAEPCHDANTTNWLDVSGNGNTVWLPDWVTVQENAMYSATLGPDPSKPTSPLSKSNLYPIFTAMNGMPSSSSVSALTEEVVTKRAANWTFTDNAGNLQCVFQTPLGYICYREHWDNGFGVSYMDGGKATYHSWQPVSGAKAKDVHTLTARLAKGRTNVSYAVDGVEDGTAFSISPYVDNASLAAEYRFFHNARADITVHAMRLYSRQLTDAEMARNAAVDAARYRGGNGRLLAASALVQGGRLKVVPRTGGMALRVSAAARARTVCVVWGTSDAGASTNGWPNVAFVGRVPANATEVEFVALPDAAQHASAGRVFLMPCYSSSEYVTDGLILQYDGIENAVVNGLRQHDPAATTWTDLTGGGADVTLPSRVTVEGNAMYVQATKEASVPVTVDGVSPSSSVLTLEVVARFCGWTIWEDIGNLQSVFTTPLGAVGYRYDDAQMFYYQYPISGGQTDLSDWSHPTALRADIHTMGLTFAEGDNAVYMDGVQDVFRASGFYKSARSEMCRIFGNARAAVRIYSVRLYNRRLTPAEFAANAALDDLRFRTVETGMRASAPLDFRSRGSVLIVR